jgi:hypothetical protein
MVAWDLARALAKPWENMGHLWKNHGNVWENHGIFGDFNGLNIGGKVGNIEENGDFGWENHVPKKAIFHGQRTWVSNVGDLDEMGKTSFRRKSGNRGFRHFCLG